MNQEILSFLHKVIAHYPIGVYYTQDATQYDIEMESGTEISFSCVMARDDMDRPARYYAVTIDNEVIADGYCPENSNKPSPIARQIMGLLQKCSDKLIKQEMHARKFGILSQIKPGKVHN